MSSSWGIFMITWNSRYRLKNNFYLFWGTSYLFYGFIILFHFLFYEGIGILINTSSALSIIFWLIGGYYLSISFLISTFFTEQPINFQKCLWGLFLITVLFIGIVICDFFSDHQLRYFEIVSEILIGLICIASLKRISDQKQRFSLKVFSNIKMGLLFFIATQGLMIVGIDNRNLFSLVCHLFQLCSFYYFFQVFVEMGVSRPMHLIFHELIQEHKAAQENEKNYQLLFDHMNEGVAYHKIITDNDGKPVDYRFLNINQSFEGHTGLKARDLIGQQLSIALPDVYHDDFNWVQKYGEVALEDKTMQFKQYSDYLDRWFHISAFCPEKGYFVSIIKDITLKQQNETELKEKQDKLAKRMKDNSQEMYTQTLSLLRIKEELKEFTCILSHDLCEPLRGIYNLSRLLETSLNEQQYDLHNNSLDQLAHLSQITHDQLKGILKFLQKTQMEQFKKR
jgi:PAS domain S-box-containing protein